MPRVMVIGTGTNVGKTYVTKALARALQAHCPEGAVTALKPVESGFAAGPDSDAEQLAAATRGFAPPSRHPLFGFPDPVSPHLAARRAGLAEVEIGQVAAWLTDLEHRVTSHVASCHWSVIETAGALFSPLGPNTTNFELASALGPAFWVLVAPDALGVLHDVRVTWEACARRGRVPDFLVLSASRTPDASTGTNADELRTLGIADPIQTLAPDASDLTPLARALLTRQQEA